jgi:hypothetical protein
VVLSIGMPSSIFSFEHIRRYAALPPAERRWHALVAGVLALLALVCPLVPRVVFGPSGCSGETIGRAAVASLSDRTEVLFLGSSHVLFGIRPQQYSVPSMSLAATWLDYSCIRRVLQKHLSSVPNLKVAVIEYDELPLVSDLVPALLSTNDPRPLEELSLSSFEFPTDDLLERLRVLWTAWSYPLTALPRLTPLQWTQRAQACSPLYRPPRGFSPGYYYTEGVTPATFDAGIVFKALSKAARDDRVVRRNLQELQRMIAELHQRGVTVVLLRLPHAPIYVSGLPMVVAARWRQLQNWAQADPRLVVIDWGERSDFQPVDFCDMHHLNVFGANKLARLLDARLRALCGPTR